MRQHYRRRSLSAWAFWTALLVGGTLYGSYRFDWLPIAGLSPATSDEAQASLDQPAEALPAPPDGRIEVAQNTVVPQTEPPVFEDDPLPTGTSAAARKTSSRLLEQRASRATPKLRANSVLPSSVEAAAIAEGAGTRSPFQNEAAAPKRDSQPRAVVQVANAVAEAEPVAVGSANVEPANVEAAKVQPAQADPAKVDPAKVDPFKVESGKIESSSVEPASIDPALAGPLESIDRLLQRNDVLAAHRELSTLYWSKPQWRRDIQERIEKTAKVIYFDPRPHFVDPCVVKPNDQLAQIGKRYNVPWQYLAKLNHIDAKRIRPGQQLKIIKGPFSAIVELNSYLLTVHAYGYFVKAYQIGIGKDGSSPLGKLTVMNKVTNPQYTDPEGRVVASNDPANPLGKRWIDLGNSYGIHGTIDPDSIGKAASRGCIRMRNEDVEEVYDLLGVGSQVTIRR